MPEELVTIWATWVRIIDAMFAPSIYRAVTLGFNIALLLLLLRFRRLIVNEIPNSFLRILKGMLVAFLIYLVLYAILLSVAQWAIWQDNDISRQFLPPHQSIAYFLGYAWLHFAKRPTFTALAAGFTAILMMILNRQYGGRFFYREEPYLAAFAILVTSWPGGLLVLILTLATGLLVQVGRWFLSGRSERLSFLFFWLPVSLAVLLVGDTIGWWIGLEEFRV